MEVFSATAQQMAVLFLLILAGFMLAKFKVLPENTDAVLSRLENYLFVPALVLGTFIKNFTAKKIRPAIGLFAASFVIGLLMTGLSFLVARLCTKDSYIRKIYTYGLAFSNFGFMGNAVVSAVFPEYFVDYIIFTMPLWMMIYMWAAPCLLMGHDGKSGRLKSLLNPMFICLIVGMLIGLTGINMPKFAMTVIDTAGGCMSPVAMLLTGVTVAHMDLKKVLSTKSIYAVSLVRLIVFPMIFVGLFSLIRFPKNLVICTVCSQAMPLGLNTIVIPRSYGQDVSVAAGMAIVSHALSVVTIPAVFYLMMRFAV